jgi:hypothetical protein
MHRPHVAPTRGEFQLIGTIDLLQTLLR